MPSHVVHYVIKLLFTANGKRVRVGCNNLRVRILVAVDNLKKLGVGEKRSKIPCIKSRSEDVMIDCRNRRRRRRHAGVGSAWIGYTAARDAHWPTRRLHPGRARTVSRDESISTLVPSDRSTLIPCRYRVRVRRSSDIARTIDV